MFVFGASMWVCSPPGVAAAAGGLEPLDGAPQVQVLLVTLTGRILSAAHIRAGTYVPQEQQQAALLSLAGEARGHRTCVCLVVMGACVLDGS
jgi:hypothetical protein